MAAHKIPVIYSRIFASVAGQNPQQVREVLKGTGVDETSVGDHLSGMTVAQYITLLRNAVRVSGNSLIALKAGMLIPTSAHGALWVASSNSPTLRKAIEVMTYFFGLRTPFCEIKLHRERGQMALHLLMDDVMLEQHNAALDFIVATLKRCILDLTLQPLMSFKLCLQRQRLLDVDEYEQVLGCSVAYEQDFDGFIFADNDLNRALPGAIAEEHEAALERVRQLSSALTASLPMKDVVVNTFFDNVGHICRVEDVAAKLFITPRTLQRRLKAESTSFQYLRDEWLAQQALKYLQKDRLPIDVSSALIGYSDEANFRRAFKRWFGCAPRQYLKAQT